jgi:hypothetical protein
MRSGFQQRKARVSPEEEGKTGGEVQAAAAISVGPKAAAAAG